MQGPVRCMRVTGPSYTHAAASTLYEIHRPMLYWWRGRCVGLESLDISAAISPYGSCEWAGPEATQHQPARCIHCHGPVQTPPLTGPYINLSRWPGRSKRSPAGDSWLVSSVDFGTVGDSLLTYEVTESCLFRQPWSKKSLDIFYSRINNFSELIYRRKYEILCCFSISTKLWYEVYVWVQPHLIWPLWISHFSH